MASCINWKTAKPKHRYLTMDEARPHATGSMYPYFCDNCGCWHVGHAARMSRRKKKKVQRYKYDGNRKKW